MRGCGTAMAPSLAQGLPIQDLEPVRRRDFPATRAGAEGEWRRLWEVFGHNTTLAEAMARFERQGGTVLAVVAMATRHAGDAMALADAMAPARGLRVGRQGALLARGCGAMALAFGRAPSLALAEGGCQAGTPWRPAASSGSQSIGSEASIFCPKGLSSISGSPIGSEASSTTPSVSPSNKEKSARCFFDPKASSAPSQSTSSSSLARRWVNIPTNSMAEGPGDGNEAKRD